MAPPYETSAAGSESPVPVVTVDVAAASDLITSAGHRYVDVRTEEEMNKGHLHNSLNVPFMFVTPQGKEKNPLFVEQFSSLVSKEEHVVVGFKNVKNMGGGYAAWLDNGFPINTPPHTMY
ncbi:thiosulfate sulfurtransferase 18 isoform X3 [Oryza sativa Japonica Group]|uniref:thiosulfate sulfurtransferase 18 isoform X3 n=1 Tax=Oryza sativa subsp. japonica TaxID=39947 RepID=UPI00339CBDDF